jgi:hypothetical protein
LARWLLTRFGCSPNNEAVIGDLDERFQAGRSGAWYWRQVFIAIWSSLFTELRLHRMLAVRALIAGWILVFTYITLLLKLINPLLMNLVQRAMPGYPSGWLNDVIWNITPHWWAYRNYYVYPTAVSVVRITLSCAAMVLIGWIIARTYAPHHRASVLLLVLTLYGISFASLCLQMTRAVDNSGLFLAAGDFVINLVAFSAALAGMWFVHVDPPQRGAA